MWRKADIRRQPHRDFPKRKPADLTGHALIDEDFLRDCGISDLGKYACVPGTEPMRITWSGTENAVTKNAAIKL